jgi:hypothetical protein
MENEFTKITGLEIGNWIYKSSRKERDISKKYEIIQILEKKKEFYFHNYYPETFETKLLESKHKHWWWDYIAIIRDENGIMEQYIVYSFQPNFSSWRESHFEKIERFS